jgi:hypothetical protein
MELATASTKPTARLSFELNAEEQQLIGAWRHEFLHIAGLSAFVSMSLNGLPDDSPESAILLADLTLPDEAAIFRAIRQGLLAFPDCISPAFAAVAQTYETLQYSADLLTGEPSILAKPNQTPAYDFAKPAWQATCREFLDTLKVFENFGISDVKPENRPAYTTPQIWILTDLLKAAACGETVTSANIDLGGPRGSSLSGAERRRWDRRNINARCSVTCKGQTLRGQLVNISVGGALLEGFDTFARGAPVTVVTDSKRVFAATVAWATGGRTGIKFEVPISVADPLLGNSSTQAVPHH